MNEVLKIKKLKISVLQNTNDINNATDLCMSMSRKNCLAEKSTATYGILKVMEDEIEARECVGASQPKSSEKTLPKAMSLVAESNSKTPNSCYYQQIH